MKKIILIPLLVLICNISFSQIAFNTGSVQMDEDLLSLNAKAKVNIKGFTFDLNVSHGIPVPKIEELLKIMEPAEIVLAKDISLIVNKPMDEVVKYYKDNKEKGWGAIAKEMGIKPGSPEFHALKAKTKKNKEHGNASKGKSHGKSNGKSNGKGKKK